MGVQELTPAGETRSVNDGQKPHKVWELDVLGAALRLERYGSFCGWSQIKLKKNGNDVYVVRMPWGSEERTESFFGQPVRSYVGDQPSFVEYIWQIAGQGRFPTVEEYVQAGFVAETEKLYRDNLQRILAAETA